MPTLKNILYIEDEPDIREVAGIALESVGSFHVHMCSSGQEALNSENAFTPDLILLDVMMPGMDGPTTLKALKKKAHYSSTPVIFMTAKVQAQEVEEYKTMGALGVISKPFDPISLPSQITEIWRQHYD